MSDERVQTEHSHVWQLSGLVIDTYPSQNTWYCDCGAATHDPQTDHLCDIGHFGQPRPGGTRT